MLHFYIVSMFLCLSVLEPTLYISVFGSFYVVSHHLRLMVSQTRQVDIHNIKISDVEHNLLPDSLSELCRGVIERQY